MSGFVDFYGSYEGFFNLTQLDDGSFVSVGGGSDGSTLTVLSFANGSGLDVSSVSPQGSSITATPGQSFAGRVATFTDENSSYNSTGDFTATIDWGDGSSPTAGTIESDGNGGFIVNGTHTYSAGGDYQPVVSITPPDVVPGVAYSDAEISSVSLSGVDGSATAGNVFTSQIATFTDSASDTYSVTVDYGDGTTPTSVTPTSLGGGEFAIDVDHTFASPSSDGYDLDVEVDASNGSSVDSLSTVTVSDASLSAAPGLVTATAGSGFNGDVATFNYPDASASASDLAASIAWGDGGTSTGTITSDGGGDFTVSGAHTFAGAGSEYPIITITDPFGATAEADDTALVYTGTPPGNQPGSSTAGEGNAYSLFFAPIAPTSGTVTNWVIDWGDNSTDDTIAGTQTFATHTFASGLPTAEITYTAKDSSGDVLKTGTWDVGMLPAAPEDVTATFSSDNTSVSLAWLENTDIANAVNVSESINGSAFTQIDSYPIDSTNLTLSGLNPSSTYAFEVSASDGSQSSGESIATDGPADDPNDDMLPTPELTGGTIADNEDTFSYTMTSGVSYNLQEMGPNDSDFSDVPLPDGTTTSVVDGVMTMTFSEGLWPGADYAFRLRAVDNNTWQVAYSNTVSVSDPLDDTLPLSDVDITGADGGAAITWGNTEFDYHDARVDAQFLLNGGEYFADAEVAGAQTIQWGGQDADGNEPGTISLIPGVAYRVRLTVAGEPAYASDWTDITAAGDAPLAAVTGVTDPTPDADGGYDISWDSYTGPGAESAGFAVAQYTQYGNSPLLQENTDIAEASRDPDITSAKVNGLGDGKQIFVPFTINYTYLMDVPSTAVSFDNDYALRLGQGTDPILIASPTGTENLVGLSITVPDNLPDGTYVTLSTDAESFVDVWSTAAPTPGSTPLFGLDAGTNEIQWIVGESAIPTELFVGATSGSTSPDDISFDILATSAETTGSLTIRDAASNPGSAVSVQIQSLNGNLLQNNDLSGATNSVLVGQEMDLMAVVTPAQLANRATYSWRVPGNTDYGFDYEDGSTGGAVPLKPDNYDLPRGGNDFTPVHTGTAQQEIRFFWVTGGSNTTSQPYTVSVSVDSATQHISKQTTINVWAPVANPTGQRFSRNATLQPIANGWLLTMAAIGGYAFQIQFNVSMPAFTSAVGEISILQLIDPQYYFKLSDGSVHSIPGDGIAAQLDTSFPAALHIGSIGSLPANVSPIAPTSSSAITYTDTPAIEEVPAGNMTVAELTLAGTWKAYIMFEAPGASTWIPLGVINWWGGTYADPPTAPTPPGTDGSGSAATAEPNWTRLFNP